MSDLSDKQRGVRLLNLGMIGNLAQAVISIAMHHNRPVTEEEVAFVEDLRDKTTRQISDFCFERGIEPAVLTRVHRRKAE